MSIVRQYPVIPGNILSIFCWKTNCRPPSLFLCPLPSAGNMKVISMLSSQRRKKFLCWAKHRALYYNVHKAQRRLSSSHNTQWSLVRRADRRGRVNTDNSPWFCFNSGTNFDKCSQTSSHYLDRRCLPYLSCFLKMFFLLETFPCFKPIMCQRQLLITFCALVKYGEERLQLSIWWMFSIFQENFSFRCSLS